MILIGARSPSDLLYARETQHWRKRHDATVLVTVDHAGPDWSGAVGVVPALLDKVELDPASTIAMVCGPEVMMRFTVRALRQRGLSSRDVFLSMERNMKCALAFCGHCQYRESFVCKDGPVFRLDRIENLLDRREI
jgi:NAD(P)H-flavin reductase